MPRSVAELQFPGLHSGDRPFISPHLRVTMKFYPLANRAADAFMEFRDAGAKVISSDPDETTASLTTLKWTKAMGQPSGHWEATIKRLGKFYGPDEFQDFAIDGDWVDIEVVRNGLPIPVCRGVVDSVRERSDSVGGATVTTWNITGRDHGAFFEYPITWANIWTQTIGELSQGLFTERVKGKIGGRPDEMFKILLEATFGSGKKSGQWRLPSALEDVTGVDRGLWELLKVITFNASTGGTAAGDEGLRGAYYNEPQLWTTGGQTLHQTLHQWCNPLLNEIWYDLMLPAAYLPKHGLDGFLKSRVIEQGKLPSTVDELAFTEDGIGVGRATGTTVTQSLASESERFATMGAFIRERPFFQRHEGRTGSMWPNLPTWFIPTWLLSSVDLGRSGNERYNLFELLADVGFVASNEQAAQAQPVWHRQDITAHGLRTMSQSTKFLAQFRKGPGDWLVERSTWQDLLVDWYGSMPYLRSGVLNAKTLLPEVRIGQRIIKDTGDPKSNEQLYCEGVQMDYTAPTQTAGAKGSTVFTVTHGFKGTDDAYFKAIKAQSELFTETF